jgi:hypothetical protein
VDADTSFVGDNNKTIVDWIGNDGGIEGAELEANVDGGA